MASYPYINLNDDGDFSAYDYFPCTTFLIDCNAKSIKISFPDVTLGNDSSLFLFSRQDTGGLGLNTCTLQAVPGQLIGGSNTRTLNNNSRLFILACNGTYRVV